MKKNVIKYKILVPGIKEETTLQILEIMKGQGNITNNFMLIFDNLNANSLKHINYQNGHKKKYKI